MTGTVDVTVSEPYPACTDGEPFIRRDNDVTPGDWLDPQNDTLWETGSPYDPCPEGYQVPSIQEWIEEIKYITNNTDAYDKLVLTAAGDRNLFGSFTTTSFDSYYWSKDPLGTKAQYVGFDNQISFFSTFFRAFGVAVRCIKMQ